jgi:hypothetical protein
MFDVLLSLDHVFSVVHCYGQAEFHTRFRVAAIKIKGVNYDNLHHTASLHRVSIIG